MENRAEGKTVAAVRLESQYPNKATNAANRRRWLVSSIGVWSFGLCLVLPGFAVALNAQSQQPPAAQDKSAADDSNSTKAAPGEAPADQQAAAISGTVEDQSGAVNVGALVRLTRPGQSAAQEARSGINGEFSFTQVSPGPFHLTISAAGFITQEVTGELQPGQFYIVPLVSLVVSGGETEVRVGGSTVEVAEQQIKIEEQQRVLGFIPNFYVNYDPNPVPLNARQKFKLAWRSSTDPITIIGAAFLAGLEQAGDDFSAYGQGMQGYGKRFGAAYADIFSGTFIGSAILPTLLKQDPRYFYRGSGSTKSRIGYALANSVICKGDNQRWQPNYSTIIGSFASGGISYLYYPKGQRTGGLLVQNSLLKIGESSLAGIVQEFVARRLTPRANRDRD